MAIIPRKILAKSGYKWDIYLYKISFYILGYLLKTKYGKLAIFTNFLFQFWRLKLETFKNNFILNFLSFLFYETLPAIKRLLTIHHLKDMSRTISWPFFFLFFFFFWIYNPSRPFFCPYSPCGTLEIWFLLRPTVPTPPLYGPLYVFITLNIEC